MGYDDKSRSLDRTPPTMDKKRDRSADLVFNKENSKPLDMATALSGFEKPDNSVQMNEANLNKSIDAIKSVLQKSAGKSKSMLGDRIQKA